MKFKNYISEEVYKKLIQKEAEKQGSANLNPRWIEAYMRLQHKTLDALSPDEFASSVRDAIKSIKIDGKEAAEKLAQSF